MAAWYSFFLSFSRRVGWASPCAAVDVQPATPKSDKLLVHPPGDRRRHRHRLHGFTLFELMITVAIAGILLAVGLPSLQDFAHGHSSGSQADELASAIRLARAESMKRGMPVSLCPSTAPDAASPACGTATAWVYGWLIFTDEQNNGTLDEGDKVLRVHSVLGSVKTITEANDAAVLSFLANGLSGRGAAKFTVRPLGDAEGGAYEINSRTLCLSNMGRVTVYKGEESCT